MGGRMGSRAKVVEYEKSDPELETMKKKKRELTLQLGQMWDRQLASLLASL